MVQALIIGSVVFRTQEQPEGHVARTVITGDIRTLVLTVVLCATLTKIHGDHTAVVAT